MSTKQLQHHLNNYSSDAGSLQTHCLSQLTAENRLFTINNERTADPLPSYPDPAVAPPLHNLQRLGAQLNLSLGARH